MNNYFGGTTFKLYILIIKFYLPHMHEKTDPMLSDSKVKAKGYT